jgi:hypothetical protein
MRAARYIEQRQSGHVTLSGDDWKIIDARIEAAKLGDIASDEEVNAIFVRLKDLRKKNTLGGLAWKNLRDTGRR